MHQNAMKYDHGRLEVVFIVTCATPGQDNLNHVTTQILLVSSDLTLNSQDHKRGGT